MIRNIMIANFKQKYNIYPRQNSANHECSILQCCQLFTFNKKFTNIIDKILVKRYNYFV